MNGTTKRYPYDPNKFKLASKKQSPKEGFTLEQIKESPFSFLTHTVGDGWEGTFLKILLSGYISPLEHRLPKKDLKTLIDKVKSVKDVFSFINPPDEDKPDSPIYRLEQYPGVYVKPEILNYKGFYGKISNQLGITFILSLSLLRKRGWHVHGDGPEGHVHGNVNRVSGSRGCNGYGSLIGKDVWTSHTFAKHLSSDGVSLDFPEMIFHYPIPLSYVEAIVCWNKRLSEWVTSIVNKTGLLNKPVYYFREFAKLPVKQYVDPTSGSPKIEYSDFDVNLCYSSIGNFLYDRPGSLTKVELYNTLLNSGFDKEKAIKMIHTKSYTELIRVLTVRTLESILTKTYPKPMIHPPYISSTKIV